MRIFQTLPLLAALSLPITSIGCNKKVADDSGKPTATETKPMKPDHSCCKPK